MTEEEHQELIKDVPKNLRAPLILLHLLTVRDFSSHVDKMIAEKLKPVEPYKKRIPMIDEYIRWLEDPDVTEEEFLRRLENQK